MQAYVCDRCNEYYSPYNMKEIQKMRKKQGYTTNIAEYKLYKENKNQTGHIQFDWSNMDICPKCYCSFLLWFGHDVKDRIDQQEKFETIEEYELYIQKFKGNGEIQV